MKLISESDRDEIAGLESRLLQFYNTCPTYPAFAQTSDYPALWQEVHARASSIARQRGACRILEIGAGRSGFGRFLQAQGADDRLHLTSQDITATNLAHLRETSHAVVTENIDRLQGSWDVIFHSYVYEHLCRPREFNEVLWRHLNSGGYLLLQSPRYDFPLYFPPCLDHLTLAVKLRQALSLIGKDLRSALGAGPHFTIFSDPSVFHLPFRRDRDAVHRVRRSDLLRLFAGRAEVANFHLAAGGWKDWIVKTFLTLRITLRKVSA